MLMDFKLGFRMLIKYPGLTIVGGLAMAFAIAMGTATFELVMQMVHPRLPLDDGDRVVGIRLWHTASSSVEEQALYDVATWRTEVKSIGEIGAFRTLDRNVITGEWQGEPVKVAEISASAFRLARVPPLLGRALLDADEAAGSPAVVVIGFDVWQMRFGSDSTVVGRTIQLGNAIHTIVGVMPEGFAFPVAHSFWTPLRLGTYARRQGPDVQVFGRLASAVTLGEAQAELTAIGLQADGAFPDTHRHLRPEVMPYARSIVPLPELGYYGTMSINIFMAMLLVLICGNVALLMFARAAARESEMVVRSALGASRRRIIMQLFAEALALGTVAAAAGVAIATYALRWWLGVSRAEAGGRLPFWFVDSLSPSTVLYAGALTILGALIAGVLPALKVTRRGLEARLRQAAPGGGGLKFGGVWTAVIVTQVAVTVAFPATTFFVGRFVVQVRSLDVGFPAEQYLSARLEMDHDDPSAERPSDFLSRFRAATQELERRLEAEPGIAGVAFTNRLPRTVHPHQRIEVEGAQATAREHVVNVASVSLDYFDVLGASVLSGRVFHAGDQQPGAWRVIVNQSFVRRVLQGRNPLGQRVRYLPRRSDDDARTTEQQAPWNEIVGVVPDLGTIHDEPSDLAALYRPLGDAPSIHMAVHVTGNPASVASRLRAVAAAVDPTLRLHDVLPLDQTGSTMWMEFNFLSQLLVVMSSVALLLSLAAIYAAMAFTVSRRRREIGIRLALGASPRKVVGAIFSKPLAQVGVGVVAGSGVVFALTQLMTGLSVKEVGIVLAYMALMMLVCMLACIVPAKRALQAEPTEALRAE